MNHQCSAGAASGLQEAGIVRGATCIWVGLPCPSLLVAGEAGKWCVVDTWCWTSMVVEDGWAARAGASKALKCGTAYGVPE